MCCWLRFRGRTATARPVRNSVHTNGRTAPWFRVPVFDALYVFRSTQLRNRAPVPLRLECGRLDPGVCREFVRPSGSNERIEAPMARREPLMPIINRVAELLPEIAAWRQDIHANP